MKRNGAQIIIDFLIAQGCDTVFGYPGGQVLSIFDALYEERTRITHIITAHEQGASHAADGYARASGRPGVVIATSGPGSTNIVTGLATAYLDSVPMLAVTGNVPTSLLGKDSFQEVDIVDITKTVTKRNWIVKDVNMLPRILKEAWQTAISGRPGPVLIDVPKDVQVALCEYEPFGKIEKLPLTRVSESYLDAVALMINKSSRPYIYFGGGVVTADAGEELKALSEKLDSPMGSSLMGLPAIPHDTPRYLGMQGMHGHYASSKAEDEADLLIAIGVRFSDRATGNKDRYAKNFRIIHIDIDSRELGKNIPADIAMEGDLKDALQRLLDKVEAKTRSEWQERIRQLQEEENEYTARAMAKTPEGSLNPYCIIDTVSKFSEGLPVATDVGQHQMWTAQRYPHSSKRSFLTSGGLGTMGYGMGAAIGASKATGKKSVLFTGDGSFGMNLNELTTAVTKKVPIVVVIMNNGVLGMVRQWQTLFFNEHYSETTLERPTDFVKLAESFGAKGIRVFSEDELEKACEEAFSCEDSFVIDCAVNCDEFVLPMLPPGGSIDDIITEL
ncbi:MAG: biosynthetic-type acetolactate synthase large subunit [Clostridiales bacterium]|nr:biosynthetic-type acetolactate synthase large subunit [Clostridiales bacterium]